MKRLLAAFAKIFGRCFLMGPPIGYLCGVVGGLIFGKKDFFELFHPLGLFLSYLVGLPYVLASALPFTFLYLWRWHKTGHVSLAFRLFLAVLTALPTLPWILAYFHAPSPAQFWIWCVLAPAVLTAALLPRDCTAREEAALTPEHPDATAVP